MPDVRPPSFVFRPDLASIAHKRVLKYHRLYIISLSFFQLQLFGKAAPMSRTLFAYLTSTPTLEEMGATLDELGLLYHHTLPADNRWDYPMHIFQREGVRLVYHAGNAAVGESMINTSVASDDVYAALLVQRTLDRLIHLYGGIIHDPEVGGRGSVA